MTPKEAAEWMVDQLNTHRLLYQETAVYDLHNLDPTLTYHNENGNLAISKKVLSQFNKLTNGGDVVWSRSERYWRFREPSDAPGRMQY